MSAAAVRRIRAQAVMELRMMLRNGESVLVTFGIPLVLLVFFSMVDVLPHEGQRSVEFLVPGVLALAVMSAAMVSLGIATGFERFYLVLKRLGATPLRRRELVVAKILSVLAIEAIQIAVILGIALAGLGYRAPGQAVRGWLALTAVGLGTAAFAGLGLAMAGRLRAMGTLAVANVAYLALLLLGGIAFPLDRLPAPVAALARLLPAAPLADLLRAALGSPTGTVGADLAVLAVWACAATALASATFRWE
ncbi:MAG TPA: ABC transporter permease [Egibacteraceae bacterium]|nr:ABC transporter permease [Egibacteraceae bacterium]